MNKIDFIKQKILVAGGSDRASLADMLLVIKYKQRQQELKIRINGVKYPLSYTAMMTIVAKENSGEDFWNFYQDSISDQSEETINFIYGILYE